MTAVGDLADAAIGEAPRAAGSALKAVRDLNKPPSPDKDASTLPPAKACPEDSAASTASPASPASAASPLPPPSPAAKGKASAKFAELPAMPPTPSRPEGKPSGRPRLVTSRTMEAGKLSFAEQDDAPPAAPAKEQESVGGGAAKPEAAKTDPALKRRHSLWEGGKAGTVADLGDLRKALPGQPPSGLFLCKHLEGHPKQLYDLAEQVGAGTFGSVRSAKNKQTGCLHAVKTCPKSLIPEAELWHEIDIMKQLDHPHVMRLYATFEDKEHVFIASEICSGGQLFDAIVSAGILSERIAAKLFKQMLSAVSYLHFKSICHRDLKPENFLLSKKGDMDQAKVKLIDFGTAKRFDLSPMATKVCTVHYVAPEVLKRNSDPYSEKVDVWSCGVILYVMLCGVPPFSHDDDLELLKIVKKGKYEFKPKRIWDKISEEAISLIKRMLCVKVAQRMTASETQESSWTQTRGSDKSSDAEVMLDDRMIKQMGKFNANNKLKKVALQVIARQISDESIEKLRSIFMKIDDDNSGTVTVAEMDEALRKLDVTDATREDMRQAMILMDEEGAGTINYTQFIASTIEKQQYLKEEVIRAAFYLFDVDGDGVISKEDLEALLGNDDCSGERSEFGLMGVSSEEIEQIMIEVDENGDGKMTYEEFLNFMSDKTEDLSAGVTARQSAAITERLIDMVDQEADGAEEDERGDEESALRKDRSPSPPMKGERMQTV